MSFLKCHYSIWKNRNKSPAAVPKGGLQRNFLWTNILLMCTWLPLISIFSPWHPSPTAPALITQSSPPRRPAEAIGPLICLKPIDHAGITFMCSRCMHWMFDLSTLQWACFFSYLHRPLAVFCPAWLWAICCRKAGMMFDTRATLRGNSRRSARKWEKQQPTQRWGDNSQRREGCKKQCLLKHHNIFFILCESIWWSFSLCWSAKV